jgi:hypothetical protein
MTVYQNAAIMSPCTKFQPIREMKLTRTGGLLASGTPRYDTFSEYVEQMGEAISSLPRAGWMSFSDPCMPEIILLVQGQRLEWCETCDLSLDQCDCEF